uniref:Uncharacterized protein n=1 Tax=Tanacetum cinerariifolium TaxID=118510 RepID=A0A699UL89_TANCI|nr:hypothetical protein [Tanacetum cinerariifolium]
MGYSITTTTTRMSSTIFDVVGDLSSQSSRKVREGIGHSSINYGLKVRNIVIRVITRSHHLNDRENDYQTKQDRLRKGVTQKEPNVYPILTGHSLSSKVIRPRHD